MICLNKHQTYLIFKTFIKKKTSRRVYTGSVIAKCNTLFIIKIEIKIIIIIV